MSPSPPRLHRSRMFFKLGSCAGATKRCIVCMQLDFFSMDLILYCRIQQLFIITLLLFASFVHPKTDIGEFTKCIFLKHFSRPGAKTTNKGFSSPFLGRRILSPSHPLTIFSARTTHPFNKVHAHALKRDIVIIVTARSSLCT